MDALFGQLDHWHWWILAVVLLIVEVLAPAFFFLWLGVAAAVTGGVLFLAPSLSWKVQALVFSLLSLVSVGLWHGFLKKNPTHTEEPTLNRRGSQYVGRIFTLPEPIVDGVGRLRVDDTTWKVMGPDLPDKAKVRVTRVNGTVLEVEEAS